MLRVQDSTSPAASLSPPKFPSFCERDVSKETVGIILRKEPRPWVGADGGLGLWEAEAGCAGPWRRQGDPDCLPPTPIPESFRAGPGGTSVSEGRGRKCFQQSKGQYVALSVCLPPPVAPKMCRPLALWPLSDLEAQLRGMGQETGWTEA